MKKFTTCNEFYVFNLLINMAGLLNTQKFGNQENKSGTNIENSGNNAQITTNTTNIYYGEWKEDKSRTDLGVDSNKRTIEANKFEAWNRPGCSYSQNRLDDNNVTANTNTNVAQSISETSANTNQKGSHKEPYFLGSTEDDEMDFEKLKFKLKELYKDIVIPCVSWLNEGEDFIFKDFYVDLQQALIAKHGPDVPMKLEEMFHDIDGTTPKRILIESPPGYGKTTLASKMVYDWASDKHYMKKFDLVFLIYLRNLNERTLADELQSIIRFCDPHTKIDINGINRTNVLLILDGCDELGSDSRQDVFKTLYKVNLDSTTVVATSRFGLFPLDKKEIEKLLPRTLPIVKTEFCQKKVAILGIGTEHRREFLEKFCPNHCPEKILSAFSKWPNKITEMLRSPLLLFLVSYFNASEMKLDKSSTLTDVYKSLINNIIKTNLIKIGMEIDDNFDLFNSSIEGYTEIQRTLADFGFECLCMLRKGDYTFKIDNFTNEVYNIGLLTKYKKRSLYSSVSYYDCFHLSVMEFSIAFYFSVKHIVHKFKLYVENPYFDLSYVLEKNAGTSLIYIFLKDLMQDKSHFIIDELRRCECKLFEDSTFWQLASTVKAMEGTAEVLADFVNSTVHFEVNSSLETFYKSELHADIIKCALQRRNRLEIIMHKYIEFALPSDITILEITFGAFRSQTFGVNRTFYTSPLRRYGHIDDYSTPIFLSSKATEVEQIAIFGLDRATPTFFNLLKFWKIQVIFPDYRDWVFNYDRKDIFGVIYKSLNENRVYGLEIHCAGQAIPELDQLFSHIAANTSLSNFLLKKPFKGSDIDLHPISHRQWEKLIISGASFTCSASSSVDKCQKCQEIVQNLEENNAFRNSDDLGLDSQCSWRHDKPKYILDAGGVTHKIAITSNSSFDSTVAEKGRSHHS